MDKSQLKSGAILSYINIIISLIVGLITVPYIVRHLGTSEYGVYSLVASLIGYISILDFGMHNVVVRYVAKYIAKDEKKAQANFLATSLLIYGLISVATIVTGILFYQNISVIFGNSLTIEEIFISKRLFVVLLINLVISLPGAVFSAIITAYEKFIFSKVTLTIKMLTRAILIFLILNLGIKSVGLVIIDLLLNIAIIAINIVYCFQILKVDIKLYRFDLNFIKGIFAYTFYVFLASITDQINWKLDSLILGALKNTTLVALSAIGMQLISYFRVFTGAISGIFLPRATKMVAQECSNMDLTDLLIKVGRYQLIIIGLLLTGFIFVGKQFITLWVGTEYLVAYNLFLIIAFSLVIPSCQSIGINIIEAKNMHQFRAKTYFFIALINAFLTIMLVPRFGVIGAAVGTACSLLVGNVGIMNWYYNRKVGLEMKRYFKEVFWKIGPYIVLCNVVCYILFSLLKLKLTWGNLAVQIVVISVLYVAIVFSKVLTREERSQVFYMVHIRKV